MWPNRIIQKLVIAFMLLPVTPAFACPSCGGDIRAKVWAGVFDEHFAWNLAATALPFVLFIGLAAAIHWSGPERPTDEDRSCPE